MSLPRGVGRSSIVEGGQLVQMGGGGGIGSKVGGGDMGGANWIKSRGGQTGLSGIFIFSSG